MESPLLRLHRYLLVAVVAVFAALPAAPAALLAAPADGPVAPTNLLANAVSQTQVNLSWTDNSLDEIGFKVERSPGGAEEWQQIGTPSANVRAFSDTGLLCGTSYDYRVRAYNATGDSEYSNTANAVTVICNPLAPCELQAEAVSQTQINLSWTDNSDNEIRFEIERSLNGSTGWALLDTVSAGVTGYQNTGLLCGTPYYYRVRAFNDGGYSGYSNTATDTTVVCAPAAPTGLSAAPAAAALQIDLAWFDNSGSESGFSVERSTDGGGTWLPLVSLAANTLAYSDTDVVCGLTYTYRLYAYNDGGSSAYSNQADASPGACPPAAPGNLGVRMFSPTQAELYWLDNSNDEDSFRIERSLDGSAGWLEIASVSKDVTAYSDGTLLPGVRYYYRVCASNPGGDSPYSNIASTGFLVYVPLAMK